MYILESIPEEPQNPCEGCPFNCSIADNYCKVKIRYDAVLAEHQRWLEQVKEVDIDKLVINWILNEVKEIGQVASGKVKVKGKKFSEFLKNAVQGGKQ